jgi:hypothetical protein
MPISLKGTVVNMGDSAEKQSGEPAWQAQTQSSEWSG